MNNRTFLMLGGYGTTGRLLARLLLQETDVRLVLAGRGAEKAEGAALEFNRLFEGNRALCCNILTDPLRSRVFGRRLTLLSQTG
ncbi:MAG: hypothetical protein ACOY9Y_08880 [Bacillota bacterium]